MRLFKYIIFMLSLLKSTTGLFLVDSLKLSRKTFNLRRDIHKLYTGNDVDLSSNTINSNDVSINYDEIVKKYNRGKLIKVEILSFGPIGASVSIDDNFCRGLILQKELSMFSKRRDNNEVKTGEILDAYVERIRDSGKVDVSLRPVDSSRINLVKAEILEAIEGSPTGDIPVGDKSSPEDIAQYFHGLSKRDFKNAIGMLINIIIDVYI